MTKSPNDERSRVIIILNFFGSLDFFMMLNPEKNFIFQTSKL